MPENGLQGILFVGDPHLSTRAPGFRKDEYPDTVLTKLQWCMSYAREQRLFVVLLGDLFHHPRDISNRLLVELISLFDQPVWAVAGNHDVSENSLCDNDTLAVLTTAGRIRLLEREGPWTGQINGATAVIGGTAWGQKLPTTFDIKVHRKYARPVFVFWVTHHDIRFPGYDDSGRFDCREIPGVDVVINGHIHRKLPDVKSEQTTWINPGNICRVSRSDATRQHVSSALRVDVTTDGWVAQHIQVPHQPFDDVFYPVTDSEAVEVGESLFIKELAALESMRTASGMGLQVFLEANLSQFSEPIAREIRELAKEVLDDGK